MCRKIEYLELRNFNGKLCALYLYERSGFAEELNIQNCENSTGNCVYYMCTKSQDLQKIWISRTVKIQGKLCTLYTHGMSWFAENLNIQNCEISTRNCEHYICTECQDLQRDWISRIE